MVFVRPLMFTVCLTVLLLSASSSSAQRPPSRFTPRPAADPVGSNTRVSVELVTDGVGLQAQQWRPVFEDIGVSLRIRQGTSRDKIETTERTVGTLRFVEVVGSLDRRGRIDFADRSFTPADKDQLARWLEQLKLYGAQGSPEGRPLWGLNEQQFATLYEALNRETTTEVKGLRLKEAVSRLAVPPDYPLRWTDSAQAWLRSQSGQIAAVRQEVKGLGTGTALAIVLNDQGLGVRPERLPSGAIELVIGPLRETADVWPAGWEPKLAQRETAPKLFEFVPVELENARLLDLFDAVSAKTGVPILLDHHRIEAKGIELATLTASHPSRKTSWSLLLRRVTNPSRLTRDVRIDERGTAFVWITTLEPGRPTER